MPDRRTHSNERFISQLGTLDNRVRANEDMIANFDIATEMRTILDNAVIADSNPLGADKGGSVPDRRIHPNTHLTQNGAVGGDKLRSFEIRLCSPIVEISQTGHETVLGCIITLNLGAGQVH